MDNNKFTPGPWRVNDCGYIGTATEPGWTIISLPPTELDERIVDGQHVKLPSKSEQFANARLIAAAPELLAALQAIVAKPYSPWGERKQFAKSAIAKALGQ